MKYLSYFLFASAVLFLTAPAYSWNSFDDIVDSTTPQKVSKTTKKSEPLKWSNAYAKTHKGCSSCGYRY